MNIWVIEYSKEQDCFNITTLEDSIQKNNRMFYNNCNNDYQIIDIAITYEQAKAKIKEMKRLKEEKEEENNRR